MAYFNFKDIKKHQQPVERGSVDGRISAYDFKDFTPEKYQDYLLDLARGITNAEGSVSPSSISINSNEISDTTALRIPDVRELYEICTTNDINSALNESIKISDIYCGRETLDLYQTRFTACKLIEARYYDCEEESQLIFFKYPYTEARRFNCTFNIRVFVNNPIVYNSILRRTYDYENPVLLYTLWRPIGNELYGTIDDLTHIDIV